MRTRYLLIMMLLLLVSCRDELNYIADPLGRHYLTYFTITDESGKSYTIIAYGKLKKRDVQNSGYLKARNRWRDGWECLIEWDGKYATVYAPYGYFEPVNLEAVPLKYQRMKDVYFYELFFDKQDSSFIRLSSSDI